jgi:hypothetical protein
MVFLKEGKVREALIRTKACPEIAVLEILKNSKATIYASDILKAQSFIENALDEGVPLDVARITPNGTMDIGEVSGITEQSILFIGNPSSPAFTFKLGRAEKVYRIVFGGSTGWFIMARNDSIYVRDY